VNEDPAVGTVLCAFGELPDPGARGFVVGDRQIIAVRWGEGVYGFVNSCPHVGVSLDIEPDQFFDFTGSYLLCSYHGAIFQPNTGKCVRGPCRGQSLTPFPLKIENGQIVVARAAG
jgi:nitrite reductase/ring-hydroxylating ferredoxin subunit